MEKKTTGATPPRILLTGVFGPYGVDDEYGRKENIMELFHNQVTRGQGAASLRFHHRSFGLYFLAENVDADVTVLDFPSKDRFVRELREGYDIVGISFIAPNMVKAREMARLTRLHAPGATIVVGGHGAAIDGIEELIDCDHVARGEGIRWLREFLGQDPDAPIRHPALPSTEYQRIFGVPVPGPTASLLVPGVGCVNGCRFCCTSHFFGKAYTPFLSTGRELFATACRIADERGTDTFFVMDENFLKDRERAMELLAEMERHQRWFKFHVFSSAEAIAAFGVENLVRLGAQFVWVGFETSTLPDAFAKNREVDAKALVRELRDHGISVLASGILCMEHHTPDNIGQDIDYMVGLEADMVQFMLLTPMPTTGFYRQCEADGTLRRDLPLEEFHGQKYLCYEHPAFPGDEPARWIDRAFARDFEVNSSSMYRTVETSLRGYRTLSARPRRDACLEVRRRQLAERTREYASMLPGLARFAEHPLERERARTLDQEISTALGRPTVKEHLLRVGAMGAMGLWKLRLASMGDRLQPRTLVTSYRATHRKGLAKSVRDIRLVTEPFRISEVPRRVACDSTVAN